MVGRSHLNYRDWMNVGTLTNLLKFIKIKMYCIVCKKVINYIYSVIVLTGRPLAIEPPYYALN